MEKHTYTFAKALFEASLLAQRGNKAGVAAFRAALQMIALNADDDYLISTLAPIIADYPLKDFQ